MSLVSLLAAADAQAAPKILRLTVVNEAGVLQAGTGVWFDNQASIRYVLTDANGSVSLRIGSSESFQEGSTFWVSRSQSLSGPCFVAPEGGGVPYTIPSPVPPSATVVLPNVIAPVERPLADRERGLVGLVNDKRQAEGLAPLAISTTLGKAAAAYVPHAYSGPSSWPQNERAHCSLSGPPMRATDVGFPAPERVAENAVFGTDSAVRAFELWMSSPPHRAAILSSKSNVMTVANDGDKWISMFGSVAPEDVARAGVTSDYGDSSLANQPGPPGPCGCIVALDPRKNPRLRATSLTRRGRQLLLRLQLDERATGRLTAGAIGTGKRSLRVVRKGSIATVRGRLAPGRWRVWVSLAHAGDYSAARLSRRVMIPR